MRSTIITLLTLLSILSSSKGFAQIEFQSISLEEAKTLARAENKLVFIDFWATWCKPCIEMEMETFSNKDVGDAINTNYIPLKLDVDYFENMDIKEMYNVSVMPTILIINSDGEVQNRLMGKKSPESLLTELNLSYYRDTVVDVDPKENKSDKKECFLKRWWNKITD
jgi:thiol:disulfide interchange protein